MDATEMLRQAATALAVGDRATATRLLAQVLQADPRNEAAWLWMAHAIGDPRRARECVERALAINPRNEEAKQLIESFDRQESRRGQVGTAQVSPGNTDASLQPQQTSEDRPNRNSLVGVQRALGKKVFGSPIGCWGMLLLFLFGIAFAGEYREQGLFWKALGDTIGGCCMGLVLLATLVWAFNKVGSVLPD